MGESWDFLSGWTSLKLTVFVAGFPGRLVLAMGPSLLRHASAPSWEKTLELSG